MIFIYVLVSIGGGNDGATLEKTLMSEKETIIGDTTVQTAENRLDVVQKTEEQKQYVECLVVYTKLNVICFRYLDVDSEKKTQENKINISVDVLTTPEPQLPKERKPWPS